MRIVVIGATSAIAEHCCREWLKQAPADLLLVARDTAKAGRIAQDLAVRSPASTIAVESVDFLDPRAIDALAERAVARPVDIVLIAQGVLPPQAELQDDLVRCRDTLAINALSPALFAEAFAARMARAGRGTIALIGSVAGDRGRKTNYVYGSAKGLVARYAEGMQHRFAGSGVAVVLVKPGPTDTPMAATHRAAGLKLAPVEDVARDTVKGIAARRPVVYTPGRWALIMLIVRHLPRFVFNRLDI
jgi:short-subunit dehydrogenase